MTAKTTSTTHGNRIPTAGAIVALGAMVVGCQAPSAAYEIEAHAQQVSSWCYGYLGTTPSLQQDCVRRAWVGVPHSECFHNPCTEQFNAYYGYRARYYASRERIEK